MLHEKEYRVVERFDDAGQLTERVWSRPDSAAPHRESGQPAREVFQPSTGKPQLLVWCDQQRGGRHRESNLPALIKTDPTTNVVIAEEYYADGLMQRSDGGPSRILRDKHTGKTLLEEFYLGGVLHRAFDLPAVIQFDAKTGKIIRLEYHLGGCLHRESGPALVEFDKDETIVLQEFYRAGELTQPFRDLPFHSP